MKGKILKVTIVAAFALIAGFNVYNAQKSDVMSDLALANVEALAQSEGSMGFVAVAFGIFMTDHVWYCRDGCDCTRCESRCMEAGNRARCHYGWR